MSAWSEHVIWWQVYPLGLVKAEPEPVETVRHRLPELIGWLDYLVELGANGLALNPVFASSTHGYDTTDYFAVDNRLGDEADLVALFQACHARGIKVLLDGVFNHVGRQHPAFRAVLERGPEAETASWFRVDWPPEWQPGDDVPAWVFEGHEALVSLNHHEPAVVEMVAEVMSYWLDRGADGWRLDAAYAVDSQFWRQVLAKVRERHLEAWIVGEVIHGDYPQLIADTGMDSITQYELWQGIWHSISQTNFFELEHSLGRHNTFCESFTPLTFVGNHDVSRIANQVGDPRHLPHALVVLFTVGGVPSIYYGDEQGYRGVKQERAGGDDEVRPEFPDSPAEFSDLGRPIHDLHQRLIAIRRRHHLTRARTEVLEVSNEVLVYRTTAAENGLIVGLNIGDDAATIPVGDGSVTIEPHGWTIRDLDLTVV